MRQMHLKFEAYIDFKANLSQKIKKFFKRREREGNDL
jgi:hypothetical protein